MDNRQSLILYIAWLLFLLGFFGFFYIWSSGQGFNLSNALLIVVLLLSALFLQREVV